MPPPSATNHLPSSHPAQRERPKSPNRVLAEAEAQWIFTESELANSPSIQDGMSPAEEKECRAKGINFIVQVGVMLRLPQLTLSTAAVFFQRFLMRTSLKKARDGIPRKHHFESAATALFLATKVEESCRKMNELVVAFCRVAQRNPNLVVDQQNKDWWKWRDGVLLCEDVLLEVLCFDLTVESPHRQLFDMLKWYSIEHNKRLRNAAWSFVTDSINTQLCLLCNSRTIAVASLYAACKYCNIQLPDDAKGRPWWETQHARLADVRKAVNFMCDNYDPATQKVDGIAAGGATGSEGERSIYVGLSSTSLDGAADGADSEWDPTRLRDHDPQTFDSRSPLGPPSERRLSNASSVGTKRDREDDASQDYDGKPPTNGGPSKTDGEAPSIKRLKLADSEQGRDTVSSSAAQDPKHREEALRIKRGNELAEADVAAPDEREDNVQAREEGEVEGSEEGELEE